MLLSRTMSDHDPIEQIERELAVEHTVRSQASDWTTDTGGDRVGRCTHPEHGHTSNNSNGTPNMIVTESGGWYCYSHKTGGGIFEWVAVEEGICACRNLPLTDEQFKEALYTAADRADVDLDGGTDYEDKSPEKQAQADLKTAVDILHDNLDAVVGGVTIRHKLKEERGFTDDMIEEAKIGYLDDQTHVELLDELTDEQLQSIGLHDGDGNLRIRNRIIYPYIRGGMPKFWTARRTEESQRGGKYDKPPSSSDLTQPAYKYTPANGGVESQAVWVVEGIQDAILTAEKGNVRAVSAVATNFSTEQINQLVEELDTAERAVVCFDADDSGQSTASDLALRLMSAGIDTRIAEIPGDGGDDPNDYLQGDGRFSDFNPQPAGRKIVKLRGETDAALKDVCSTVEPNSPRADRMVEAIANDTPFQKRTLRKQIRENHRYESQQGWKEPERLEKTAGVDTKWTLIYPDGEQIELDQITGWGAAKSFCEKYAATFNYAPSLDEDDWIDMINEWMEEVGVTEVDPLSAEGLARHNVLKNLSQATISDTWHDAIHTPHIAGGYKGDDTILVTSEKIDDWTDDDVALRMVSEYIDQLMGGETQTKRHDGVSARMWPINVEAVEGSDYTIPDPQGTPDDKTRDDVEVDGVGESL